MRALKTGVLRTSVEGKSKSEQWRMLRPNRLSGVRAAGAHRAFLSQAWAWGIHRDPSLDGKLHDDPSDDGKCICSAKATNILEVAIEEPRRSKSVYDAAPP